MRWSNDVYVSTPHRVVNRGGRERFSVAFFFDPSKQGDLERAVLAAARDPERLSLVASTAQKHVTKEWSLRRSAQQLLEVASAVRRRHGASPSL